MPIMKKRKVKLAVRTKRGSKRSRPFFYANPIPAAVSLPINIDTTKQKTYIAQYYTPTNDPTAVGFVMDDIGRGTSDTERVGSKWMPTALHLRGRVNANLGGNDTQILGYYIVWDKSPSGAAAQFSQVFTGSSPFFSFPASSTDDRFEIIAQKRFNLTVQNTAPGEANSNSQHLVDHYIRLPGKHVCHSTIGTTSGAIGNRTMGALLMFMYSESANGSQVTSNATLSHRTYFADV